MTETLTTSGAVKLKAGAKVSTALTAANYTTLINQAEGFICEQSKYDFVTNYSSLSTIGKAFLDHIASSHAAFFAINYDQSGYTSRQESQVMLDTNWTSVVEGANLLRDNKFVDFIIKGNTE